MENIYAGKTKKELSDILLEFSSYKTVIQGCSTKTVDEYLLDLATFARFILAKRAGISPESDEFAEIDISSADAEFFKSVKTPEIYEFCMPGRQKKHVGGKSPQALGNKGALQVHDHQEKHAV